MNKENRIIALIDLTESSQNLIDFTYEFAECIDAKIVFVHQILGLVPGISDQQTRDEIIHVEKEDAKSKMRNLAQKIEGRTDTFYASEKRIPNILQELKNSQYFDWVITGLKNTGLLKRLFIGSTTLSIIEDTDFLTIAVPFKSTISLPKKLMVGVTHKFPLNKAEFSTVLASLANQIEEVTFFTILEAEDDERLAMKNIAELQSEYSDFNSRAYLSKEKDALTTFKEYALHEEAFLVLQQGSRSLQDQLLRKFMINELVYIGQTPLIVISR